jgi:hypothetical protein
MYSMPYSSSLSCVSPSNVGNYAAQTTGMISDETKGNRVLTVLNSWDSGKNAVTQTFSLPAGSYRILLDMKYECPNQTGNNGRVVTTSGGNVNSSLTGIRYGKVTDYRYPSVPSTWETICYDFTLTETTDVTFSLGYESSQGQGAANNTLLYIDNVRLLKASYERVMQGSGWGTICLPNAALPVEGVTAYTVAGRSDDYRKLFLEEQAAKMEAGIPYVFFSTSKAAAFDLLLNEEAGAPKEGANQLLGTFLPISKQLADGEFVLYKDEWYKCTAEQSFSVEANQAYLKEYESIPVIASADREMSIHDDGTGIVLVNDNADGISGNGASYTINGSKATEDARGIIISKGRKEIRK